MQPEISKTSWWQGILYGAGLLALLVLLTPGWAGAITRSVADLVVDNGATQIVPPSITFDNETIGDTSQGTLLQFSGSNTVNSILILGDQPTGRGTYNLFNGSLSADLAYIGNEGTGIFTQLGGTYNTSRLLLGSESTGSGSYTLIAGSLSALDVEEIGRIGAGTFIHLGGTNTTENLNVGDAGWGSYQLISGILNSGDSTIGNSGTGMFTQIGGTNSGNALTLGLSTTGSGSYKLIGGLLSEVNASFIGDLGSGSFVQSGGTHIENTNLVLGLAPSSSGTYQLSGGSLQVRDETLGNSGTGSFVQTGGSHMAEELILGFNSTGSGTYQLYSGILQVQPSDERIGLHGTGSFAQIGGSHMANSLILAEGPGSSGTYNLSGGNLQADREIIGGSGIGNFTHTAGTNTTAGLWLGYEPGSTGTYTLNSGQLSAQTEFVGVNGSGTFNHTGGTNTMDLGLILGAFAGSSGTYNLSGGQLSAGNILISSPAIGGSGTFNVMNTITTVTGNVENFGTVKTTNAIVTWDGSFTNNGVYVSDSSTQTFKQNLTVGSSGNIVATLSQDLFILQEDFINNHTTKDLVWNTAQAGLKFITGTDTSHTFAIAGDGSTAGHRFAWHSLDITGQTLRLQDGDTGANGAQWLEALIGAKFADTTLTNIFNDDPNNVLNLYYDKNLAINAYLGGLDYTITGGAGGMLIAHTPLPPSVLLLGTGLLGLGAVGWSRRQG